MRSLDNYLSRINITAKCTGHVLCFIYRRRTIRRFRLASVDSRNTLIRENRMRRVSRIWTDK